MHDGASLGLVTGGISSPPSEPILPLAAPQRIRDDPDSTLRKPRSAWLVGTFEALGQDVTSDRFLKLSGQHFGTKTCFGDSGGPVFANGFVVAVVSFGQSIVCASNGYYTRVDTESVSSWIASTLDDISGT